MASLSEHAKAIRDAVLAATEDGYRVVPDATTVYYNGQVETIEIDLFDGKEYVNLLKWDWTE